MGRKKLSKDEGKVAQLPSVRVTSADFKKMKARAVACSRPLAQWIRVTLQAAIQQQEHS